MGISIFLIQTPDSKHVREKSTGGDLMTAQAGRLITGLKLDRQKASNVLSGQCAQQIGPAYPQVPQLIFVGTLISKILTVWELIIIPLNLHE